MQLIGEFLSLTRLNIPDIYGPYDLVNLSNALVDRGFANPLRSDFIARVKSLGAKGRIDAQGLAFLYEQYLGKMFLGGINALFAHVSFAA